VGEKTGQAAMVYSHIRTSFEQTVETSSGRLVSLLEPAVLLVTGVIILLIIVQFVVPLYSLYGATL
jgi:type IV pilus assembly protein PilC